MNTTIENVKIRMSDKHIPAIIDHVEFDETIKNVALLEDTEKKVETICKFSLSGIYAEVSESLPESEDEIDIMSFMDSKVAETLVKDLQAEFTDEDGYVLVDQHGSDFLYTEKAEKIIRTAFNKWSNLSETIHAKQTRVDREKQIASMKKMKQKIDVINAEKKTIQLEKRREKEEKQTADKMIRKAVLGMSAEDRILHEKNMAVKKKQEEIDIQLKHLDTLDESSPEFATVLTEILAKSELLEKSIDW